MNLYVNFRAHIYVLNLSMWNCSKTCWFCL